MTNREAIITMSLEELAKLLTPEYDCRDCVLSRDVCDEYYDQKPSVCEKKVRRWLEQEIQVRREDKGNELNSIIETNKTEIWVRNDVYTIATKFERNFNREKDPIVTDVSATTVVVKRINGKDEDVSNAFDGEMFVSYTGENYYEIEEEIIKKVNDQHECIVEECKEKATNGLI